MNKQKSIEELRKYRYGTWAGNKKGHPYKEGYCAHELFGDYIGRQCSRKNGHGRNGLYCKQHGKIK